MVRIATRSAVVALCLVIAGCANVPPRELPAEDLKAKAEFVSRATGYDLNPLPSILISKHAMDRARAGLTERVAYSPALTYSRGIIYVDETQGHPGAAAYEAAIIHELVHHGQRMAYLKVARSRDRAEADRFRRERGWICGRSLEREAIRVQLEWLRGRDEIERIRLRTLDIDKLSACPSGWSPNLF